MICKYVKNSVGGNKTGRVNGLASYITNPQTQNRVEKCVAHGGRNFVSEDIRGMQAEMLALAESNIRSGDPIEHFVLSWQEGEQPSRAQIEDAVEIWAKEMQVENLQMIWGAHANTDNFHLHLMLNRINIQTGKAEQITGGWYMDSSAKAALAVENRQGWAPEKNARFVEVEEGVVISAGREESDNKLAPVRQVLENAKTWQDLHGGLKKLGAAFETKGSGANLKIDGEDVKPSAVSRKASFKKLESRLGKFEHYIEPEELKNVRRHDTAHIDKLDVNSKRHIAGNGLRVLPERNLAKNKQGRNPGLVQTNVRDGGRAANELRRQPAAAGTGRDHGRAIGILGLVGDFPARPARSGRPAGPEPRTRGLLSPEFQKYLSEKNAAKQQREAALAAVKSRQAGERARLSGEHKKTRDEIFRRDWRGKGEALNAMRSVIAAQQAVDKLNLKDRHKVEMKDARKAHPYFPDFEKWKRQRGVFEHPKQETLSISGNDPVEPRVKDLRDFKAARCDGGVAFEAQPGRVAFVDYGKQIVLEDPKRENVLAALQLSAQKWGKFSITGDEQFKKLCATFAAEHGFQIKNPEMQAMIKSEQDRLQKEAQESKKIPAAKDFEKVHEALAAEKYRVTLGKFRRDNKLGQASLLDANKKGFTAEQLQTRFAKLQRLEKNGENIYFTPLDSKKHFLVVDDLTRESFDRMMQDGFKPAVLLETHPGSYQAIIAVPKTDHPEDYRAAVKIAQKLNKKYGDPKVQNAVQPFRAPGFANQKPKYLQPGGGYPQAKVLDTRKRECNKTQELLNAKAKELQKANEERVKAHARQVEHKPRMEYLVTDRGVDLNHVYLRHQKDIETRFRELKEQSRIDAMIAMRMHICGHSREDISQAIQNNTPRGAEIDDTSYDRKQSERDLKRYSDRAASFPESAEGRKQAAGLEKYRKQWQQLENSGHAKQTQLEQAAQGPQPQQAPTQERDAQGPELPENQLAKVAEQEQAEAERQEREQERQRSSGPELG